MRSLLLILLALLLLILAACSAPSAPSTTAPQAPKPAAPTAPPAAKPTEAAKAAAAATVAPTSAPAAKATEAPKAATGPATLVVYTALEDDELAKYKPLWEKAYPDIKLDIVRDSTGVITAKFLAEKDNPKADVIWGLAATSLLVADQQGLLEPYAPADLPKVNPTLRDTANPPKWTGIKAWEAALCVNTKELEAKRLPMPESWEDLTKPVYKGQIVMPNPSSSGTGYLAIWGWIQAMGEEKAWKFQDALHENIAQYVHSGSRPCRMAGAGEYPIGISFGYRAVTQAKAGEPIKAVWPKEGSGWDLEANALVKKPTIKPQTKTFLDWAISEPLMKEYAKVYPVTSIPTGDPIPDGYLKEPMKQMIQTDLGKAAAQREKILQQWTAKYDSKSAPR